MKGFFICCSFFCYLSLVSTGLYLRPYSGDRCREDLHDVGLLDSPLEETADADPTTTYTFNRPNPGQEITIVLPNNVQEPVREETNTPPLEAKPTDPTRGDELMSMLKAQDTRIKALEDLVRKLLDKTDETEEQVKVNDVLFKNVHEGKNEHNKKTVNNVLQVINGMMKVKAKPEDIAVALRVHTNSSDSSNRPILVTFTNYATKMKVLAARNKLSQSNIEVLAVYSEKVNQRRRDLLPFLEEKRTQGRHAFILYDKLVVDNAMMTLEELEAEKKEEQSTTEYAGVFSEEAEDKQTAGQPFEETLTGDSGLVVEFVDDFLSMVDDKSDSEEIW